MNNVDGVEQYKRIKGSCMFNTVSRFVTYYIMVAVRVCKHAKTWTE